MFGTFYEAVWPQVFAQTLTMVAIVEGALAEFDQELPLPALYLSGLRRLSGLDEPREFCTSGRALAISAIVGLGAGRASKTDPLLSEGLTSSESERADREARGEPQQEAEVGSGKTLPATTACHSTPSCTGARGRSESAPRRRRRRRRRRRALREKRRSSGRVDDENCSFQTYGVQISAAALELQRKGERHDVGGRFLQDFHDVRTKLALLSGTISEGEVFRRSERLKKHVDDGTVVPAEGFEVRRQRDERDVAVLSAYEREINHAVAEPRFHDRCAFCGGRKLCPVTDLAGRTLIFTLHPGKCSKFLRSEPRINCPFYREHFALARTRRVCSYR